jgi:hypothetical protein
MFMKQKQMKKSLVLMLMVLVTLTMTVMAQETKSSVTATADFVSSYIWRGSKFGNGPAIEPTVKFTSGGFTVGAWGNYCFSDNEADETDFFASINFGKVNLGLSKYYFVGTSFFKTDNHAFEVNGGLSLGNFSLSANYILNEAAGAKGGDTYIEASLTAGNVNIFAGAGNGWYTPTSNFNLCNVGLKVSRNIAITDRFTLPISGSLILNPATEQLFLVAAFTL